MSAQLDAIIPRRKAFREILNCSVSTGWRRENTDPTFPKPIQIGPSRYGYRMSELQAWIAARPRKGAQHG